MNIRYSTAVALFCAAAAFGRGRASLSVVTLEGTARIQRAGERQFRALESGGSIAADDMLETGAASRVFLDCTRGNTVVLGAASRALIHYRHDARRNRGAVSALTLTLFSGSVLLEIDEPCSVTVLTPLAQVRCTRGAVSIIADPASGESGVQALCGDSIRVASLSDHNARTLSQGQTTVIRDAIHSIAPHAFTPTHEAVLAMLYGAQRVSGRLDRCGVRTQAEAAGGSGLPGATHELAAQSTAAPRDRPGSYTRVHRLNDIYGAIIDDRQRRFHFFRPVTPRGPLFENAGAIGLGLHTAVAGGRSHGAVTLTPSYRWRFIEAALELEVARNYSGWSVPAFSGGIEGVLDLLDHLTVGYVPDSLFVTVGRLHNYTVAEGLVVKRYTNHQPYSLLQPAGLFGKALLADILSINAFVGDITRFDMGGLHAYLRASGVFLGLGFYADANQYHTPLPRAGDRFVAMPDTQPAGSIEQLRVCEVNLGYNLIDDEYVELRVMGQAAYRFRTLTRSDGYVLRVPELQLGVAGMQVNIGWQQEYGRMISPLFSSYYSTNRYRVVDDANGLLTQNGMLSEQRRTRALYLAWRYAPRPGLAFESEYCQDVCATNVYSDSAHADRNSYSYHLSVSINDALLPLVHTARLGVDHMHGALYPPGADFPDSWGLRVFFHARSRPLFRRLALEAGFDYYLLDLDFDNRATASDRIYSLYGALHWGLF